MNVQSELDNASSFTRRPLIKAIKGLVAAAFLGGCRLGSPPFPREVEGDASASDASSDAAHDADSQDAGKADSSSDANGDARDDANGDANTDTDANANSDATTDAAPLTDGGPDAG